MRAVGRVEMTEVYMSEQYGATSNEDTKGMVFNLEGVEEKDSFELIPKGTYSAIVDSLEFGDSKAGNPMITVVYEITESEFAKRKLYDFMVMQGNGSEFGLAKLKKFLIRVCPEVDIGSFNPTAFADNGIAIGRECCIVLKIQTQKTGEYKGEKRNTVSDVLAPSNSGSFL
jgi:hypothetical protein